MVLIRGLKLEFWGNNFPNRNLKNDWSVRYNFFGGLLKNSTNFGLNTTTYICNGEYYLLQI